MAQKLIGGWQVNGITAFQSGRPYNLSITGATVGLANRPDVAPGGTVQRLKTAARWFDTSAFRLPAFGMYGNAGRNLIRGPGINKWDISLFKNFRITERVQTQFRWETFNAFNNANFEGVSMALGTGNFGQVTTARDPRTMQFGLKLEF